MISLFRRKKKDQEQKPKKKLYKLVIGGKKMYLKDEEKIKRYKALSESNPMIMIKKVKCQK